MEIIENSKIIQAPGFTCRQSKEARGFSTDRRYLRLSDRKTGQVFKNAKNSGVGTIAFLRCNDRRLKMGVIGLAFLGVVLGAIGTEFLRAKKPELVEKIEDSARRFVDAIHSSEPADEEVKEK
ncbi:MAG: hypothetical protein ACYS9Y_14555 [Planctomycetota bacterium]